MNAFSTPGTASVESSAAPALDEFTAEPGTPTTTPVPVAAPLAGEEPAAETTPETTPETTEGDLDDDGASPARGGARGVLTRAQVRRILVKAEELEKVEPRVRAIAAGILGCQDTVVELTSVIMTGDTRSLTQVASDLENVRTLAEMEAGLVVATLSKPRFRALWTLAAATGAELGKIPASDVKAALKLATAVRELDEIAVGEIESATALLRKN